MSRKDTGRKVFLPTDRKVVSTRHDNHNRQVNTAEVHQDESKRKRLAFQEENQSFDRPEFLSSRYQNQISQLQRTDRVGRSFQERRKRNWQGVEEESRGHKKPRRGMIQQLFHSFLYAKYFVPHEMTL